MELLLRCRILERAIHRLKAWVCVNRTRRTHFMNKNALYLIIGALIVVVAGFSYYAYEQEKQPDGVEIKIGEGGVSVQEN
ncbi:hypothetical protein SAMN05880582_106210 [Rhizobium sp. RU20A]|nr:hypothetical protein SAMN05880582_106210 [Rhizobium sp. RU20A]